jgi:hypothetical protein
MKTQIYFTLLFFLLIGFNLSAKNSIVSLKTSEERTVEPFTKIDLGISATLILVQADVQKVSIEADADALKLIETKVENSTLIIKVSKWHFTNLGKVTIYISVPKIEGLDVSGSGKIIAQNKISTEAIQLEISGSGSIELSNLSANNVKSEISGSGNIKLTGSKAITFLSITISGSGDLYATDLSTDEANISISGSGDCKVNVKSKLTAEISGSGKVRYLGDPKKVDVDVSGSGSVKKMDK